MKENFKNVSEKQGNMRLNSVNSKKKKHESVNSLQFKLVERCVRIK